MKTIPQYMLPLRADKPRHEAVFKRRGSKFWQARFYVGETFYRRTTGAVTREGAVIAIPLLKRQVTTPPPLDCVTTATTPDLFLRQESTFPNS